VTRIESTEHAVVFELHPRERQLLEYLLRAYPAVPQNYQAGSAKPGADHAAECERLLQEALATQRDANKRQLEKWLAAPKRFVKVDEGVHFTLERTEAEWFLQVLNDVRVGNWLLLGEPESGQIDEENVTPEQLPMWLAMEMSGYFQMNVLEALGG
jgi:hypothetical protein